MSLIGGSSDADFSFDGIGDFDFGDLVKDISSDASSSMESKLEGITKTEVFSFINETGTTDQGTTEFYDAKTFIKLNKNDVSPGEKILAGLLLEKEGEKPVLMTRGGDAVQLESRAIRIHQEAADGTEVIRKFDQRQITIGSLTDEQYARIHSSAMTNLAFIAKQQRDIDSEAKTGAKLKELASLRDIKPKLVGEEGRVTNKIFQQQALSFSRNREVLNRRMEFLFNEEKISEERQGEAIEKKKEGREEITISQDSKREVVVEEKKLMDRS